MPTGRSLAAAILASLVWAVPLQASETLVPARTATPPVIDGDLSDPVWQSAPSVTGFKSWFPDFGKAMPDDTIASIYAVDEQPESEVQAGSPEYAQAAILRYK